MIKDVDRDVKANQDKLMKSDKPVYDKAQQIRIGLKGIVVKSPVNAE